MDKRNYGHSSYLCGAIYLHACFITLFLANPATAKDKRDLPSSYTDCIEAADGKGPSPIKQCVDDEGKALDRLLNDSYRNAIAGKPFLSERIRASERAWLIYREETCNVELGKWGDGSAAGINEQGDCSVMTTEERIDWLRSVAGTP